MLIINQTCMKIFKIRNLKEIFAVAKPILWTMCITLFSIGIYYIFWLSPEDFRQGHWVKMMYFHVPAAWIALMTYVGMTVCAICYLSWKFVICEIFLQILGKIGTFFCAICLITGIVWGKFIWGVWWAWDARLTSMLMLFLFYLTHFIVRNSVHEEPKQHHIIATLTILGCINLPIIKYSVDLWTTAHQKSSLKMFGKASMPTEMIIPLILMFGSFVCAAAIFSIKDFDTILKKKKGLQKFQ